jgi:hypothetical protein
MANASTQNEECDWCSLRRLNTRKRKIMTKEESKERAEKTREARVRRAVARRDHYLMKSRTRNWQVPDYGLYAVMDPNTNASVNPALCQHWVCSWTLDDLEAWLKA